MPLVKLILINSVGYKRNSHVNFGSISLLAVCAFWVH